MQPRRFPIVVQITSVPISAQRPMAFHGTRGSLSSAGATMPAQYDGVSEHWAMSAALKRSLAAPLWCHAAALLVVLLALIPLARPDTVFFADEGSALAQAHQLSNGDGWTRPLSFPAADPETKSYPLFVGAVANGQVAPLGAHPVYALVLEPWYAVGGSVGAAMLSVVAVWGPSSG